MGEQSRDALEDFVTRFKAQPGEEVMRSWGRPVGPVVAGSRDAAESLLRSGHAFAAPEFVESDPDRQFGYVQAERLARQNRLGVHGVYTQDPADFRADPKYVVPRETIAQFWDTPTPRQGLPAEFEQELQRLAYDPETPIEDVVAYARTHGAVVDPAQVRASRDFYLERGQKGGLEYPPEVQVLTDQGDGSVGAAIRGYGSGFLAGGLDEAGAIVDVLGGTPDRENVWNSDRRIADVFANNLRQNQSILGYDASAHPIATTAANVTGALTSGFVIPFGQGARTVPQLARVGAAYGATEGYLGTDGPWQERLTGAAIGAPVGAVVNAVGGKAIEAVAPAAAQLGQRMARRRTGGASEEGITSAAGGQVSEAAQSADLPPLPPGAMLDPPAAAMAMDGEAMPAISAELRQRDFIDTGAATKPTDIEQPLTEAQRAALAEDIRPQDVLPAPANSSGPADELSSTPQISATEDWPTAAVSRAGNINLDKLESPQDIRRALKTTHDRVGFDTATRRRVTHAETERLAGELGMTADSLLARRKGQALNAEEALAARQILARSGNELVNAAKRMKALDDPGDEALADFRRMWMRHVAIQEQVAGMTAEAGRTLQQFRMAANARDVRGGVLAALVRGGGGKDNLQDVAERLIEAAEVSPGVFNTVAKKATKPRWQRAVSEYYINALLSGPQTHVVNMVSNALTAVAQIPEHAAASMIGSARQAFTRNAVDRVVASEVGARAFGLIQGAKEGAKMFARALRTGEASDFTSKVEGEEFKAIPGPLGEIVRIPTRFLTAEDELFKGIARRMAINGLAVRKARREGLKGDDLKKRIADLSANPPDDIFARALEYGRYLTFQQSLGPIGTKVSAVTNESLIAKVFLPFVRTPANLLKFAVERSPAAPLLKEWRKDFAAGGARRDLAIAKASLGSGLGMAMYEAALKGQITGSPPSDQQKARLLYADGWQPYSIKIGDQWFSYMRLDPFSTTIGVAADLATLPEGMTEKQRENETALFVASILGNLASKTWMSGISDLVSALDEPDRYADNMLQRLVGSFLVPTGVVQVTRVTDPTRREAGNMSEALQSRVPGLSENLMPRRDIWGRPVVSQGGLGPDFISPVWVSEQLQDPVNSELLQLDYAPGYPPKTYHLDGERREWTSEQYDRLQEIAGQAAHSQLTELVNDSVWRDLTYDERIDAARAVVGSAREAARAAVLDGRTTAEALADPVAKEMVRAGYFPSRVSRTVGNRRLSEDEYQRYQSEADRLTRERLSELVSAPGWDALPKAAKADAMKSVVATARRDVRSGLPANTDLPSLPPGAVMD